MELRCQRIYKEHDYKKIKRIESPAQEACSYGVYGAAGTGICR